MGWVGRAIVHGYVTLWLFNIAMKNGLFIDGLPKNDDFLVRYIEMLNNQMMMRMTMRIRMMMMMMMMMMRMTMISMMVRMIMQGTM